ncbi:MAG: ribosome maturation factor RimM [Rickettsiales bacterium]
MTSDARVLLGVIGAPHGVKGQVKIKTFTEVPENLTAYGTLTDRTGKISYDIKIVRSVSDQIIATVEGYPDRTAVEKLRGQELYVARSQLPPLAEGEYYTEDLVGLRVFSSDGEDYGAILGLHDFGAGILAEIKDPSGKAEFFSLNNFVEIDVEKRTAVLEKPDIFLIDKPE